MKIGIIAAFLFIVSPTVFAQNLVIDGGLEDTLKCPQSIGRFYHWSNTNERYTTHWRSTTPASPDYHNQCGYSSFQPNTGRGYAGLLYYDPSEVREYITALLSDTLIAGEKYHLEYYVALNGNSTLAVDEVQVHFSAGVPLSTTFPPPYPYALTPHLQAASAPTSTSYQLISGCYTATGGEDAITFGNFYDNASTTTTTVSSTGSVNSYYFLDDVKLIHLYANATGNGPSLAADTISGASYQWINCEGNTPISGAISETYQATTSGDYAVIVTLGECSDTSSCVNVDFSSLPELSETSVSVYPNPATEKLQVSWSGEVNKIQLVDLSGRIVWESASTSGQNLEIDVSKLAKGVYELHLLNDRSFVTKKVVKK
ncbi:MAG: T9SS type A sorting domain-containing protein [bacterium]|nr:T9SS type A sorting domain-containing protein [bacterium]